MLPLRPGDRNGETLIYDQPTLQRREGDRHRMQAAPVTRAGINVMIITRGVGACRELDATDVLAVRLSPFRQARMT